MIFRAAVFTVFVLTVPALAFAREDASAPAARSAVPAISARPRATSATFGNWVLRCNRIGRGALATHVCEVASALRVRGQQAPVAQVAIGRPAAGAGANGKRPALRLTLLLPVNVSLDQKPALAMRQGDTHPIELPWRRCVPTGCFADAAVSNAIMATLRSRTKPMQILFKDATERNIVLPLSPLGLPQALDAFTKKEAAK